MDAPQTPQDSIQRLRDMPISRLFPNMVTIAGLCCGFSAIRFALAEKWEIAIIFMIVAAILDAMDGMVARLLKATSQFGAQLDSLTDVICFGVTPALIFWLWALEDFKRYGWAAVLFYIACCALRLARFNVSLTKQPRHPAERFFFTGVPAPGGAMLVIAPMMLSFHNVDLFHHNAPLAALYLASIGGLMASRLPTIAAKNFRIPTDYVPYVLVAVTVIMAFSIITPWVTLPLLGALYLLSMPISAYIYYRKLAIPR
ncbi:MAG: CDP-diacylglycerol--serine O-phosphatidyltransferase [Rickettsiales bacterium]|nr:CDP-diacylglycerol--serine O-phosphatidyltransferase [Rickettsiales bacterium]